MKPNRASLCVPTSTLLNREKSQNFMLQKQEKQTIDNNLSSQLNNESGNIDDYEDCCSGATRDIKRENAEKNWNVNSKFASFSVETNVIDICI